MTAMDFAGRVALVTGAGGGIGAATSIAFAQAGASVVLVDIDPKGEAVAERIRVSGREAAFVQADVSKAADVQRYVEAAVGRFGRIDAFFNNAGVVGRIGSILEMDEASFDAVMAVNVKGAFLGLRHVLPVMVRQGVGAVVNTSSITAVAAPQRMAPYVASKHAIVGLTKAASAEVAPHGVRVNVIHPALTPTPMIDDILRQVGTDQEGMGRSATPTGHNNTPEGIADAVLFLCSGMADNITGTGLIIDGGKTA